MEKDFIYLELAELYGGMLTPHQSEIIRSYYAYDLSLSEIAEEKGTTRQSVADALAKARKELSGLEERLGLRRRAARMEEVLGRMREVEAARPFADEIAKILGE